MEAWVRLGTHASSVSLINGAHTPRPGYARFQRAPHPQTQTSEACVPGKGTLSQAQHAGSVRTQAGFGLTCSDAQFIFGTLHQQ